jgi:hypothetical protein
MGLHNVGVHDLGMCSLGVYRWACTIAHAWHGHAKRDVYSEVKIKYDVHMFKAK